MNDTKQASIGEVCPEINNSEFIVRPLRLVL